MGRTVEHGRGEGHRLLDARLQVERGVEHTDRVHRAASAARCLEVNAGEVGAVGTEHATVDSYVPHAATHLLQERQMFRDDVDRECSEETGLRASERAGRDCVARRTEPMAKVSQVKVLLRYTWLKLGRSKRRPKKSWRRQHNIACVGEAES